MNKQIFTRIYKQKKWRHRKCPLSGSGSTLRNTKMVRNLLDEFIKTNSLKSITDLGCGDLTWITSTNFFNEPSIDYTGVDVVDMLIEGHIARVEGKKFISIDLVDYTNMPYTNLVILRDVIFHLSIVDIQTIFNNIKGRFDYILITNCRNTENTDNFNKYQYSMRNIHIEPFNINNRFIHSIQEKFIERDVYIYRHDDFYNLPK